MRHSSPYLKAVQQNCMKTLYPKNTIFASLKYHWVTLSEWHHHQLFSPATYGDMGESILKLA
jgi:hypothetical protein